MIAPSWHGVTPTYKTRENGAGFLQRNPIKITMYLMIIRLLLILGYGLLLFLRVIKHESVHDLIHFVCEDPCIHLVYNDFFISLQYIAATLNYSLPWIG